MSHIRYTDSLTGITPEHLQGLHVGWPNPPTPATHLKSLSNMNARTFAIDENTGQVIGFVCGMTDSTLILYIWDIEVLPDYQGQGIEDQLLARLLEGYTDIYQINVVTLPERAQLFMAAGFATHLQCVGMTRMHMSMQDGGTRKA